MLEETLVVCTWFIFFHTFWQIHKKIALLHQVQKIHIFSFLMLLALWMHTCSWRTVILFRINTRLPRVSTPTHIILCQHAILQVIRFIMIASNGYWFSEILFSLQFHVLLEGVIENTNASVFELTFFQKYFIFITKKHVSAAEFSPAAGSTNCTVTHSSPNYSSFK